ncbi:acyltransferase [Marinomonas arenicola]|uniref:DapH/DapD/GlmU-related protein n=1 Tax=Marinomonas arenicola TaxID=569601 RepID=A0ABU9G5M1_9GAMM
MFLKLIVNFCVFIRADVYEIYLRHLFLKVREEKYRKKYSRNLKLINQGGGSIEISGDPKRFKFGVGSHIKSNTFIECSGGVVIGDYFHTGRGLTIFSTSHNWKSNKKLPYDEETLIRPVSIGNYVWLGANVTILPGAIIGDGVVVAAGSVVRGVVAERAVVSGNPAAVIAFRDEYEYLKLLDGKKFF